MDRTLVVQLVPTPDQADLLSRTLREHTACFNAVARLGFETKCKNGIELHNATYYPLRAEYSDLPAQLVCAARVKATEAVKSALSWQKKHAARYQKRLAKAKKRAKQPPVFKPIRCPQSKLAPIRYDQRSFWIRWDRQRASLATVGGRIEIGFTVPHYARRYIGAKVCSADLCFRNGRYFLHIVVSIPAPSVEPSEEVIGVDLGLTRPAVTSNRLFLGEKRWKGQERRIFRIRRKLQKNGSKSARRHLKRLSGKRFRQRRDHDHVVSKQIVEAATLGSTIVLENLTDIRDSSKIGRGKNDKTVDTKRRFHSWSHAQFYSFVSYKAEEQGIAVVKIDPRHTSQRCSRCGHQARNNRRSQSLFLCRKCGYCLNADYNAAKNIREKYLTSRAQGGISVLSGSPRQAAYRLDSSSDEPGTSPQPFGVGT